MWRQPEKSRPGRDRLLRRKKIKKYFLLLDCKLPFTWGKLNLGKAIKQPFRYDLTPKGHHNSSRSNFKRSILKSLKHKEIKSIKKLRLLNKTSRHYAKSVGMNTPTSNPGHGMNKDRISKLEDGPEEFHRTAQKETKIYQKKLRDTEGEMVFSKRSRSREYKKW